MNKYGNPTFWYGCVEDRQDPLMLGRCRVRVVGIHTDNKVELPTKDLPWAYPIQSVTSAAMSGIGESPVGPVEGTWVILIFNDNSFQQPMMLGTLGGIPIQQAATTSDDIEQFLFNEAAPVVKPPETAVTDSSGTPIQTGSGGTLVSEGSEKVLGSLTQDQVNSLKAAIAKKESGGKADPYSAVNTLGYLGKYQFGSPALQDLGYVKKGTSFSSKALASPDVWTGKDGINSKEDFLRAQSVQESVMDRYLKINYNRLKPKYLDENTPEEKTAGVLAAAHNQGTGGAIKMLKGEVTKDAYGTSTKEFYDIGYGSVTGGQKTAEVPTAENVSEKAADAVDPKSTSGETVGQTTNAALKNRVVGSAAVGFVDASGKYPLKSHLREPDTNRLARHQKVGQTIVGEKDAARIKNVQIANSGKTWNQPEVPYNARYPFNHVLGTESGHYMEFDDTAGSERVNIHHKAGTFLEIDKNGTQCNRIVGNGYTIYERDGFILVQGSCHVHVDGGTSVFVGGDCNLQVGGDLQYKVGGNMNGAVAGNYSLTVGGTFAVDAALVHLNSGLAAPLAPNNPSIVELPLMTRSMEAELAFETQGEMSDVYAKRKEDTVTEEPPPEKKVEEDVKEPEKKEEVKLECDLVGPITKGTKLSANYSVGTLCPGNGGAKGLVEQHGLSVEKIACNLKKLSVNCLEPIKQKYPNFIISSGFRWSGSGISKSSGVSKHELGQAADMQFPGISREGYYDVAVAIKNLVPFDQLLLEYRGSSTWIHISFTESNRNQIGTLYNDSAKVPDKSGMGKFIKLVA